MEGKIFYYFGNFWEVMVYIPSIDKWACRRRDTGYIDYFEPEVLISVLSKNKFWE